MLTGDDFLTEQMNLICASDEDMKLIGEKPEWQCCFFPHGSYRGISVLTYSTLNEPESKKLTSKFLKQCIGSNDDYYGVAGLTRTETPRMVFINYYCVVPDTCI